MFDFQYSALLIKEYLREIDKNTKTFYRQIQKQNESVFIFKFITIL